MSAERHRNETASVPADAANQRRSSRSIPPFDGRRLETNRTRTPAAGEATDRRRLDSLGARIQRTRLELQIVALERALETSERRRQEVIDRYERLLDDRTATGDESTTDSRPGSLLRRLLED